MRSEDGEVAGPELVGRGAWGFVAPLEGFYLSEKGAIGELRWGLTGSDFHWQGVTLAP